MALGALGIGIIVASFGASIGALYLLQYLYQHRDRSGAAWFMGNIASVALFCLSYGCALLIFDPTLRVVLEAVSFVCVCFMGPFFLAFGLDYTGRGDLIRSPLFVGVAAVPILSIGFVATNSHHHLVWTDLQFTSVFGLSTVTYTTEPLGIFAFLFSIGTAAVGSLLLIGAILSYGPLYRREATAVILSTVPPSLGVSLWVFGVGPVPELHLTAPFMLAHVALDAYAFVGTHMFETNPSTQRMAERSGLDSLSEPVLVLDNEQQVVRANGRAEELFADALSEPLPLSLEIVLGVSLVPLRETGEVTVGTDRGGVFAVSYTPLTEPGGESVGSLVVLYDITEKRQREQQLAVLNRILRHNLRNETSVISGYAELLQSDTDDPSQSKRAGIIRAASDRLNSIGEKVRRFESVQERVVQPEAVPIEGVLQEITETCFGEHEEATVEWTLEPSDLQLRTDPKLLTLLLRNLIENTIVHSEAPASAVQVSVSEPPADSDSVTFEIRDDNEPIPEHEIETLRAGEETPLQHGQGVGLWIVYWCVKKLHGEIEFEYENGNVITVTLPTLRG